MIASTPETQAQIDAFRADRVYLGADHARNERRTWIVAVICLLTLAAQIAGGIAFNSMALVANGLHLAAHVAALLVAAGAYGLARRFADDARFSFGTGKLGYLAGFANASVLAVTALFIAFESIARLLAPAPVAYDGALALAAGALVVNLICMWLLRPAHAHAHDRDGDLNLSAAHLHLAADAAVSALAIFGLALGRFFGWAWADSLAGLAGAALVAHFAWRLLHRAGAVLLDMNPSPELTAEIRARLVTGDERLLDLHLWRLGPGHHAAIAVIEAKAPLAASAYRARLAGLPGLSHVTVETRDSR
ncbi:MAG: CDF family Co(II)/Ni(II) efflux transporter DmeF [Phenylobacterium sp.]|uniref:CDF family Co(II)/Ni(II) efflux transporter DmeF n=1 Tax=Phenylobacterium sp. TaxID=1871053 RepID=UPI002734B781|nr:CDF family Co(II)/Ni(II) efflux transporter DmeF [Phenylobacterium sp.]MDP3750161.1 CDF family Co(II)/Ni(II) efflux transporter DmeF [Phenylobacterium sp.]